MIIIHYYPFFTIINHNQPFFSPRREWCVFCSFYRKRRMVFDETMESVDIIVFNTSRAVESSFWRLDIFDLKTSLIFLTQEIPMASLGVWLRFWCRIFGDTKLVHPSPTFPQLVLQRLVACFAKEVWNSKKSSKRMTMTTICCSSRFAESKQGGHGLTMKTWFDHAWNMYTHNSFIMVFDTLNL